MLAFGSQKLTFPRGTQVFGDGQITDGGYVVISGEVKLVQAINGQDREIGIFRSGDLIGELAVLTKNYRVGTALVVNDCELMKLSRMTMHRILREYPELAAQLQAKISNDVASFGKNLARVERRISAGDKA